jgi:hypothetical protein
MRSQETRPQEMRSQETRSQEMRSQETCRFIRKFAC